MTIRLIDTVTLARVLLKDARTIARWCEAGDIECVVRGTGPARRYQILVFDGHARVLGVEIDVTDELKAA